MTEVKFLLDTSDRFYKSIKGYAMPETVIYDPEGRIYFHARGPINVGEVTQKLAELSKNEKK
jgi:uncharacterized FAD-dependent dehydrogenase